MASETNRFRAAAREKLAELAHVQWSGWMRWMLPKITHGERNAWVERWTRQMSTDYVKLSEAERDSDRREADRVLDLIEPMVRLEVDAARDAAYAERNQIVAALAKVFSAGITRTAIEGWDPEWHNCVYIDLPTGQVSWHYHDRESHLFNHLPAYTRPWDGHSTAEKYQRLAALPGGLLATERRRGGGRRD